MDDERPQTDWEARVAKAKREGTWFTPDEEPSPYPPREKRKRFWVGFAAALVLGTVLQTLLHLVSGRPGSPFSLDNLIDALIGSVFVALLTGWWCTRPPRTKR